MEFTISFELFDRIETYIQKKENETVLEAVQRILIKEKLPAGTIIEIWNQMGKCEQNIQFKQLIDSKHIKVILLKDFQFFLKNEEQLKQDFFIMPVNLSHTIGKLEETLQNDILGSNVFIENIQHDMKVFDLLKRNIQLSFTLFMKITLKLSYEQKKIQQQFSAFQTIRQIKQQFEKQQAFQGLKLFQMIRESDNLILDQPPFIDSSLYQLSIEDDETIILQKVQSITVKIKNLQKEYQIDLETTLEKINEFIQTDNQIPNNNYRLLYNQKKVQQFEDIIKNVDQNFMIELTLEFQQQIFETTLCDSLNLLERQQFFIHPQLSIQAAFKEDENTECVFFWKNIKLQQKMSFLEQNISAKSFIVKYRNLQQFERKNNLVQSDFSNLMQLKNAISKSQNYKKIGRKVTKIKLEDFYGQAKQQVINLNQSSLDFEAFNEQDSLFIFQKQFVNLNDKELLIKLKEGDIIKYSAKFQVQLIDESSRYIFRRFYNFKEQIQKMKSDFLEEFPKFKNQEFKIILDDENDQNEVQMQDQFMKFKTLTMQLQFKAKLPIDTTLKIQFQDKNKTIKCINRTFNKKTITLKKIKFALMEEFSIDDDQELYFEGNLVELGKNLLDNGIINNDTLIFQKSQAAKFQVTIIYNEEPLGIPYKMFSNETLNDLIQKFKRDKNIPETQTIDLFFDGNALEKRDLSKTLQQLAISDGCEIEVQI